jgi:hypothetical protein
MRHVAVALAALVLAPAAGAWTTLGSGVGVTTIPSVLVTQTGSLLASFDTPNGTIQLSRNGATPKVLVSGDPIAGRTQLLQQPNGALQLYFPNAQGVGRLTSTDDGQSWTGPIKTQSHTTGPVNGGAVAPDGTPYFAQDGTGFVNVFEGLNGERVKNVYTRCCGYHESLAVDSSGLAQVAFFSNADPDWATVYEPLAADLAPVSSTPLKPVAEHEAPLVPDHTGTTFLAWAPGYPTAASLSVVPFRGGVPSGDGVTFHGSFAGADPHIALAVDAQDRVWVFWTQNAVLHAARSRSHGVHFGATVSTPLPGTAYQLAAAGIGSGVGSAEVVVTTGPALMSTTVQPGLSIRVTKTTKKIGKKRVVTHFAQALDDGFGVPQATFKIGGRTIHADATGKAKVPAGRGTASAQGYVSAPFRVP